MLLSLDYSILLKNSDVQVIGKPVAAILEVVMSSGN